MKPSHTPGPWLINVAPNGETSGIISANGGMTHIADTFDAAYHNAIARGQVHPATEFLVQSQANARLIAAAPDLLAALKEMNAVAGEVLSYLSLAHGPNPLEQYKGQIDKLHAGMMKAWNASLEAEQKATK